MRSAALILTFGTGAILVQTTVLPMAAVGLPAPDLVLVLCVYLGLYHQHAGGALAAFFLGYFLDTFSGSDLGLNAFVMTLVFFLVYLLSRRLWIEGGWPNVLIVCAAAVVKALTGLILASGFSQPLSGSSFRDDILAGLMAAAVSPLVLAALGRSKHWLRLADHG